MLGQHRSTQRHLPRGREDEDRLVADMIELARHYFRYGYRRIAATSATPAGRSTTSGSSGCGSAPFDGLRMRGLKVSQKQPKRGCLWFNDGSSVRLRPEHPNQIWAYDFVNDRT